MGYDFCAVPPWSWELGPPSSLRNYVVEKGPGTVEESVIIIQHGERETINLM
jgi:hypothetical protein